MAPSTPRLIGLLLAGILLAACGPTSPSATEPPGSVAPSTETPPAPSRSAATSAAPTLSQTETEFGRIWDGVPEGFPRFRGGRDADDAGPEPASDVYVVQGGDAAVIAEWLQSAMEDATYSTEALSGPFEDGSYELVSTGAAGCRIRTTITPQGDLIRVSVLYGAACPAA